MADFERLICGDCKGTVEVPTKRGSAVLEALLWSTLFFPGFFYAMWRRKKPKPTCRYCGSNFMLPADSPFISDLLKPITKIKS